MDPRLPDVGPGGLLIRAFRRRFPVSDTDRYSDAYWDELRSEFATHVALGQVFFPIGLIVGAFLFPATIGGFTFWDLGIGFGVGVAFAFGYQLLICAAKGFSKSYQKLSDYSTMMYGFPWSVQLRAGYLPFLLIGVGCAVVRLFARQ